MFEDKRILVHSCCAPCSGSVFERLEQAGYSIEGFFYNPNIFPKEEYLRRKDEYIMFSKLNNYKITVKESFKLWQDSIKGFEYEKEGGKRCEICFRIRLEETAKYAKDNNFNCFTTVLTVSPHKNSITINQIGNILADKYDITFLEADFKKQNGFKRSLEISKKFNLYRQSYCGCVYSIRTNQVGDYST